MFASLNQGSLIYILDKSDEPKLKIGEVVSVSAPHTNFTPNSQFGTQTLVDLKVKVDGNIIDYKSIPSSYNIVTYNNGGITISETKQGLQSEVESLLQNSKSVVDNIDMYQKNIVSYESILKDLNPQFAKDKERDDRLDSLEDKIDKIFNLLNK